MHNIFPVTDTGLFKQQLLHWANQFSSCLFLDNNQYQSPWQNEECMLAAGAMHTVVAAAGSAYPQLQQFLNQNQGKWIFGHLGYDLKNETEGFTSPQPDRIGFADLHFFVPMVVVKLAAGGAEIIIQDAALQARQVFEAITQTGVPAGNQPGGVQLQSRFSHRAYVETVNNLRQHILRGDCYEINFCQEFYAEGRTIDPLDIYQKLGTASPNPFSCYYRQHHQYLLCASPERFLMKRDGRLFSQPIKGTAGRSGNPQQDAANHQYLQQSPKERSENVMVVDLVRNDLSRICEEGSVQVDELFGIYSYPQVYQMISTISGIPRAGVSFTDIMRATFPMGSMTGAPKRRVIQLVDMYEQSRRGLFSGAVGYIAPNGNFDLNVVIRSILYNDKEKYVSCPVGSGITWYANAEAEYDECLVKVAAIRKVLEGV